MISDAKAAAALNEELKNVCVDISKDTSFSGYKTHLSLWNHRELLGVGRLVVPWNRQSLVIAEIAFEVELLDEKGAQFPSECRTDRYPYGYEYSATMDMFRISGSCSFYDSDSLFAVFRLLNEGTEGRSFSVRIRGRSPCDGRAKRAIQNGNILCVHYNAARVDARDPLPSVDIYYAITANLPVFNIDSSFSEKEDALKSRELRYSIQSEVIHLEPNESRNISVVVCLGIMNSSWAVNHCREVISSEKKPFETIAVLKQSASAILTSMPPLPETHSSYRRLYHHAGLVLLMNSYGPYTYSPMREKNTFGNRCGVFPNRGVFCGFWIEDSSLQALGLREWLPETAEEQILLNLDNQDEAGKIAMFPTIFAPLLREETQNPILSWACWSLYKKTNSLSFLEHVYPILKRYNDWWFRERDRDGDGLCEFCRGEESGNDNSPRWDTRSGEEEIGAKDIEAVDLSSYLIVDSRCLAKMAEKLGTTDDSVFWYRRCRELEDKVLENMYDEEDNLFYDIWYDTHAYRKIVTPMNFMPLWAGVPIEVAKAREMIERSLLNEILLFGRIPFPSVAYSEPTYRPDGFWRGPTWISHAYYMLQVLSRYGFRREADAAAERILQMAQSNSYIYEWYDSQTGRGNRSVAEYSWSASLIIEILLGRYHDPVVG